MTLTEPLLPAPLLVHKPWGGLSDPATGEPVGECWDVTDLPAGATPVVAPVSELGGPLAGTTLAHAMRVPTALLGRSRVGPQGRFPLLVKTLHAAQTLSVQVHPPRTLAPDAFKSEAWVVLDAAADGFVLLGVHAGVTLQDVRGAVGTSAVVGLLRRIPVTAGDVFHVAPGTLHALGAGVTVAEVQTPSDITYRVWDWPQERAAPRELHVADAMASIEARWDRNTEPVVQPADEGLIVDDPAFRIHRHSVAPGAPLPRVDAEDLARVVFVTAGALRWRWSDGSDASSRPSPSAFILPAACTTAITAGEDGCEVLIAVCA